MSEEEKEDATAIHQVAEDLALALCRSAEKHELDLIEGLTAVGCLFLSTLKVAAKDARSKGSIGEIRSLTIQAAMAAFDACGAVVHISPIPPKGDGGLN